MGIGHSHTEPGDLYYECTECEYASSLEVGIGLCPRCGTLLVEQSAFA